MTACDVPPDSVATQNSTNVDTTADIPSKDMSGGSGKLLYLFSGHARPEDGVDVFSAALGFQCRCIDTEISPERDLLDDAIWQNVWDELHQYEARLLSPPCGTFSAARNSADGGPRPLRSPTGPGRYGLKDLRPEEKEKVRVGNVLAIRSSRVCKRSQTEKTPWILEQPHHNVRRGKTSMFTLDEFQELLNMDGVFKYTFDQCMFGAMREKATDLLSNIEGMETFNRRCNHPVQSWTIPWSGEVVHSARPPLKGRQQAIPSSEWGEHMLQKYEPKGEFLTRKAAAYTADMNQALAVSLTAAVKASRQLPRQPKVVWGERNVEDSELNPLPHMSLPLKGVTSERSQPSDLYSLRNVHKSVTERMLYFGKQISNLLDRRLDQSPHIQEILLQNLGRPLESIALPNQWIDNARAFCNLVSRVVGCPSPEGHEL